MGTGNQIWIPTAGHLVPLDLFEDTALLLTFQANDRAKPDTIQSSYSFEFEAPGSNHNHALLKQAAAAQGTARQPYKQLQAILTSGGVETLPNAILLLKGYTNGRYQLQLADGNITLVQAIGDKMLSDLNLSRFNHLWNPKEISKRLSYGYWYANGFGYEIYDRGTPLDFNNIDPYSLYPSVAYQLVFNQLIADAGFTADDLIGEPLYAALNIPSANPYVFPQSLRDAVRAKGGYLYDALVNPPTLYQHSAAFGDELLIFPFTTTAPYYSPAYASTGATYFAGRYTAGVLGYYDLQANVVCGLEINSNSLGKIRVKFMLKVNGQSVFAANGGELGKDQLDTHSSVQQTFSPQLNRFLLRPGDYVELWWHGEEINYPSGTHWRIGPYGSHTVLAGGLVLANEVTFTATLLPEFPQGGLIKLTDWLPEMKQIDFLKSAMLLLGLTIQANPYTNHLQLSTGAQLRASIPLARDWSGKRDAVQATGRVPERSLAFRFGTYGQVNTLRWTSDDNVTAGYGDGVITVADQVLPLTNELATLPFATSQPSPVLAKFLRILNFTVRDASASPVAYSAVVAKPRLTLRLADGEFSGSLVLTPADSVKGTAAVLQAFTSTPSTFAGAGTLSLLLNGTVLTTYWADLRSMLDKSRYLTERYRLTPQDIAELDYSVPIWDAVLGDYFAVSAVSEYDARRSVEVTLCRLNPGHFPPPALPSGAVGVEFYDQEFYTGLGEFY